MEILNIFKPNAKISKHNFIIMCIIQLVVVFGYWTLGHSTFIPSPMEIFRAFGDMTNKFNLWSELFESTFLALKAVVITTVISMGIAYLTVIPFFRPLAYIVSKMRFLSLVGLSFIFTMMTHSGSQLKISILVFGMSVFFVTSLCDVIASINKNEFIHARTLRMSEWQVVWEVIIRGKMDQVFEVIRQNFAIAWMMLTMVEGICRSEGGVGTLLLNESKYMKIDSIFAIQITILLVGVFFDFLFGYLRNVLFPYATMTKEKN
jgi:NitT/TauT family transport system permease protein